MCECCPIQSLPTELLARIFSYTTLGERRAQQCTCQQFRAVGNTPDVVESQALNTYRNTFQTVCTTAPDPALIAILKEKTGLPMSLRSHYAHVLLAGYLKVTPGRCLKTLGGSDDLNRHTNRVNGMTDLGNGQLASGSHDRTIKIWGYGDTSKPSVTEHRAQEAEA